MNLNPKKLVSLFVLSAPLAFGGAPARAQSMPMPKTAAPAAAANPSGAQAKAPAGNPKQPDLRPPSERDPALHVTVAQGTAQPAHKGHPAAAATAPAPTAAAKDPHDGMAPASAAGGATTKYPDGRSVTVAPDGTTTTTFPGGRSVSTMPDGCTVRRSPDGMSTATHADGSSTTTMPDGQMSKTAAPTAGKPGGKKPGMKGDMCCGKDPAMGGGMEGEMGGMGSGGGMKKKAPKHPKADQPATDSPPSDPGMGGDM
jgi:hypothetical protein